MTSSDSFVWRMIDLKQKMFPSPRPFEKLAIKGNGLVGAEIGVYKGEHAESLLKNLSIDKLILIDPYELYEDYADGRRHYGVDQDILEKAEVEAKERLGRYSDKVIWVKDFSSDCLDRIPDDLDFVYIDGNHTSPFVDNDIFNYYPKVRIGGVLGGHDFDNGGCPEHSDVVQAVTHFVSKNNLMLYAEKPDWWVIKNKSREFYHE